MKWKYEKEFKKATLESPEVYKHIDLYEYKDFLELELEKALAVIDRYKGDWLPFEENKLLFNEEAKKNCLCKFDDGTVIRYNEEHPWAIMTHFKKA